MLERPDAELAETDGACRMSMSDKVALLGVVGNEAGAHHVVAECLQALNDVGSTVAASAGAYWVGEAMPGVDYRDHDETPEKTAGAISTAAANAAHLARRAEWYPAPEWVTPCPLGACGARCDRVEWGRDPGAGGARQRGGDVGR